MVMWPRRVNQSNGERVSKAHKLIYVSDGVRGKRGLLTRSLQPIGGWRGVLHSL